VRQFKQHIDLYVRHDNADPSTFRWVATADPTVQKIDGIAKRIPATGH
jgi:hypothetical protein